MRAIVARISSIWASVCVCSATVCFCSADSFIVFGASDRAVIDETSHAFEIQSRKFASSLDGLEMGLLLRQLRLLLFGVELYQ